ncbi:MAG: helix-turn-helix domain-containing protein [Alphaproteobacteria bacterium]
MNTIKCVIDENRIQRFRPREGKWFHGLRHGAQVTRRELAEQVDVDIDLIHAIERGSAEVPAALYPDFAVVFGVTAHEFAKTCLMYENPSAYEVLFGALPRELREAA